MHDGIAQQKTISVHVTETSFLNPSPRKYAPHRFTITPRTGRVAYEKNRCEINFADFPRWMIYKQMNLLWKF